MIKVKMTLIKLTCQHKHDHDEEFQLETESYLASIASHTISAHIFAEQIEKNTMITDRYQHWATQRSSTKENANMLKRGSK